MKNQRGVRANKLSPNRVGVVFGMVLAFIHFVWLLMVWLGVAQIYLDWILGLHHVGMAYAILSFNWLNALTLLIVTFVAGYLIGAVFTVLWNKYAHKR